MEDDRQSISFDVDAAPAIAHIVVTVEAGVLRVRVAEGLPTVDGIDGHGDVRVLQQCLVHAVDEESECIVVLRVDVFVVFLRRKDIVESNLTRRAWAVRHEVEFKDARVERCLARHSVQIRIAGHAEVG